MKVTLDAWKLQRVPNDSEVTKKPAVDFPLWIILEGHKKIDEDPTRDKSGEKAQSILWHSSLIVKRLDARHLMTASGKVYEIRGSMDQAGMRDSGWSEDLIKLFIDGFPEDWLFFLEPFLQIDRKRIPRLKPPQSAPKLRDSIQHEQTLGDPQRTSLDTDDHVFSQYVEMADPKLPTADFIQEDLHMANLSNSRGDDCVRKRTKRISLIDKENGVSVLTKHQRAHSLTSAESCLSSKIQQMVPTKKKPDIAKSCRNVLQKSPTPTALLSASPEDTSMAVVSTSRRSGRMIVPPLPYWENQYKVTDKHGSSSVVRYK